MEKEAEEIKSINTITYLKKTQNDIPFFQSMLKVINQDPSILDNEKIIPGTNQENELYQCIMETIKCVGRNKPLLLQKITNIAHANANKFEENLKQYPLLSYKHLQIKHFLEKRRQKIFFFENPWKLKPSGNK